MDRCATRGVGIMVAGAYNSGILAGGCPYDYRAALPAIVARGTASRTACAAAGVPLEAAALQFRLAHPAVLSVVVGARDAGLRPAMRISISDALPTGPSNGRCRIGPQSTGTFRPPIGCPFWPRLERSPTQ